MSIDVKLFSQFKHLSSNGRSTAVFDVMTGSLLELDGVSTAILEEAMLFGDFSSDALDSALRLLRYMGHSEKNIITGYDLIEELREKGLFAVQNRSFTSASLPEAPQLSSLTLNVSQTCQLKCAYCFASGGDYQNPLLSPLMSKEIGIKAIDFFFQIADQSVQKYKIFFFGGEPLLNWDTVVDLTYYAEAKAYTAGKQIIFSVTTNAIGLNDETVKFLRDHKFSVLVSVDGDESLHNELRPHKADNVNSYEETIKGISLLKSHLGMVCGRATVTSLCHDMPLLQQNLCKAGCDASIYGIVSCEPGHKLSLSDTSFRELTHQLCEALFEDIPGPEIQMIKSIKARLNSGYMSLWSCSFSHALSVDSIGDIYACHRLSSNEKFYLGSIYKGINEQKLILLRNSVMVDFMTGCRSCWARYLCGAACPADSYLLQGSISNASSYNCYLYQKLYESAIEAKMVQLKMSSTNIP